MKSKRDLRHKPKCRKWVDLSKTLAQLEGWTPKEPEYKSGIVLRGERLSSKVPLKEFTAGDLRFMIGQMMSLEYLVPLAIDRLREDPLLNAEYYPGDLLTHVLSIRDEFWHEHTDLKREVDKILASTVKKLESLSEEEAEFFDAIRKAIRYYRPMA